MTPAPEEQEHRVLRERLGAYVLDGLDPAERAGVDAHLAGCASCRAELASLAPLAGPLRGVDPDASDRSGPAPAPTGFDDVLRRLREEAPDQDVPDEDGPARGRSGPRRWCRSRPGAAARGPGCSSRRPRC